MVLLRRSRAVVVLSAALFAHACVSGAQRPVRAAMDERCPRVAPVAAQVAPVTAQVAPVEAGVALASSERTSSASWVPFSTPSFWFVAPSTLVQHPMEVIDGEAYFLEFEGVLLRSEPFFDASATVVGREEITLGDRRATLETRERNGQGETLLRWSLPPSRVRARGQRVVLLEPALIALRWSGAAQRATAERVARSVRFSEAPANAETPPESDALLGVLELGYLARGREHDDVDRSLAERAARHLRRALRHAPDAERRVEWAAYLVDALVTLADHRAVIEVASSVRRSERAAASDRAYSVVMLAECEARLLSGEGVEALARCPEAIAATSGSEWRRRAETIERYAEHLLSIGRLAEARAQFAAVEVSSLAPASVARRTTALARLEQLETRATREPRTR